MPYLIEARTGEFVVMGSDAPCGPAAILTNGRSCRLTPVGEAEGLVQSTVRVLRSDRISAEALRRHADNLMKERSVAAYTELNGTLIEQNSRNDITSRSV